jgi:DNA-directed RNA polymerase specialized sigma24 family protein
LPGEDKNKTVKVFQQSHVELETASDGNLVARVRRGDEAAFAALFDSYKHRIYGFMTGSPQVAEELTEEAFLGVFRKMSTFCGEPSLFTRLERLAVKAVLMHLRKKRVPEVPPAQKGNHELWPQRPSISTSSISTGQVSTRRYPFKAAGARTLLNDRVLDTKAPGATAGWSRSFSRPAISGRQFGEFSITVPKTVGRRLSVAWSALSRANSILLVSAGRTLEFPTHRFQ